MSTMEELVQEMISACESDVVSMERSEPGLAKLRLLPKVEEQTSKQSLQDSFIDAGGLGAIREWLRLLPDNSLPNLTLRSSMLQIVQKLTPSATIESLKESRIGHAIRDVIFHSEEVSSNKRIANEIAESWLRTIFGRDTGHVAIKATEADMQRAAQARRDRNRISTAREDDDDEGRIRRSAIATLNASKESTLFRVQPVHRVLRNESLGITGGSSGERIHKAVQQRQLKKRSGTGTSKVSVEGRGLQ